MGDPDQSIYGFRGADVRGILKFPERFRTREGRDAPVVALRVCRRSGEELLEASRRVAARLPAAPMPDGGRSGGHRDLLPLPETPAGDVRVLLADSTSQEAAVVADTLRRAHLIDGVPWHRMAVLVRSAIRQVPLLRRALVNAGVPTMIAGDEVPIAQEPGVRPLLTMLRVALDVTELDEGVAEELLTGPLGGTDMIGVRRLRRALKIAENEATTAEEPDHPRRAGSREARHSRRRPGMSPRRCGARGASRHPAVRGAVSGSCSSPPSRTHASSYG